MFTVGSKSASFAALARQTGLRTLHSGGAGGIRNGQWLDKILIANRGEIACRVMRTAKRMGVRTVAVYSDQDKNAMHVGLADEAYHIGPSPSAESYLRMDKIIDVAKKSGAKGIHPGYGFLSENAVFAEECKKHGLVFIGPPASAIRSMGSKSESKRIMESSGVPLVRGYHGSDQSLHTLQHAADSIGYPVLIKAVLGGGGKGMRVVTCREDFPDMLESSRHEARKHFADDRVLVEKYVSDPRHVEVQVFCDTHGNAVYLFERDCSLQRRHQKVIEEAPAPHLPPAVRSSIGESAVRAARAVGYVGAGTVEFIVDTHTLTYYFMEMNTRLQVEHCVSEMITGTDLVEWQLRVASGEPLPRTQDTLGIRGHAFEARIYAEDPRGGFLPGSGRLSYMHAPTPSSDVRVETGVRQGDEVSVHYDPMIAKLVVWGEDRTQALAKLDAELANYNHPGFIAGDVSTSFIAQHKQKLLPEHFVVPPQVIAQCAVGVVLRDEGRCRADVSESTADVSPWKVLTGFRVSGEHTVAVPLTAEGKKYDVRVTRVADGHRVMWEGLPAPIVVQSGHFTGDDHTLLSAHVDGEYVRNRVVFHDNAVHIFTKSGHFSLSEAAPAFMSASAATTASSTLTAPMTGSVERVTCTRGSRVNKGDILVVMEAMKMELVLRAPMSGRIARVDAVPGRIVQQNTVLVQFEEEETQK